MGLLEEGDVDDREAERDEEDEKAQPEEDDLVLHVVEVDWLWSEKSPTGRNHPLSLLGLQRQEVVEILNLDDKKDPC